MKVSRPIVLAALSLTAGVSLLVLFLPHSLGQKEGKEGTNTIKVRGATYAWVNGKTRKLDSVRIYILRDHKLEAHDTSDKSGEYSVEVKKGGPIIVIFSRKGYLNIVIPDESCDGDDLILRPTLTSIVDVEAVWGKDYTKAREATVVALAERIGDLSIVQGKTPREDWSALKGVKVELRTERGRKDKDTEVGVSLFVGEKQIASGLIKGQTLEEASRNAFQLKVDTEITRDLIMKGVITKITTSDKHGPWEFTCTLKFIFSDDTTVELRHRDAVRLPGAGGKFEVYDKPED
jgi:hypothetical protein